LTERLRSEEFRELPLEEGLRELAKELPSGRRLNLADYFELLDWANLYACLPADGTWTTGLGYEIGGIHYGLLFTDQYSATEVAGAEYVPKRVRGREMLSRLPDGWGVIVDYGTDAEVRISPDKLTELNERFRIKPVRQEATDSWLAMTNESLKGSGIALSQRAEKTKEMWSELNGLRVLPNSRRARRIEWYFNVVADATAGEARQRCDTFWRAEYLLDSYLQHLTDIELQERLTAIRTNLMYTDRDTLPHELSEIEWRELQEHVRYEFERRGLAFYEAIPVAERLAAWPRIDAAKVAFQRFVGPKGHLFKFGKLKDLEPLLRKGVIRINPAATYKEDTSLLPAQCDDELNRTVLLDASRLHIEHIGKDGVRHPLHAIGASKLTASAGTNFYVWCMSTTFDARLFDDFGANACLIIHDGETLINRMHAAMSAALPTWVGANMLVHYFDPVKPGDALLSSRDKDFRFAYQREYRFLWDPADSEKVMTLNPLDLCLGSLDGIASLITL
jgi:hypothetical protein